MIKCNFSKILISKIHFLGWIEGNVRLSKINFFVLGNSTLVNAEQVWFGRLNFINFAENLRFAKDTQGENDQFSKFVAFKTLPMNPLTRPHLFSYIKKAKEPLRFL